MKTRKEIYGELMKVTEMAGNDTQMLIAHNVVALEVQLDIRDLLEGIDRRLGVQQIIKKVVKKNK